MNGPIDELIELEGDFADENAAERWELVVEQIEAGQALPAAVAKHLAAVGVDFSPKKRGRPTVVPALPAWAPKKAPAKKVAKPNGKPGRPKKVV